MRHFGDVVPPVLVVLHAALLSDAASDRFAGPRTAAAAAVAVAVVAASVASVASVASAASAVAPACSFHDRCADGPSPMDQGAPVYGTYLLLDETVDHSSCD
uniref:Putative secreted peptide n=1 Tax=Anopheles braziliensis TaxID=58242 RepID=A0A2M3ZQV7_9DIPT